MREVSTTKAMARRGNVSEVRNESAVLHTKPKEVGVQEVPVSVQRDERNDLSQKPNTAKEVVYSDLADMQQQERRERETATEDNRGDV